MPFAFYTPTGMVETVTDAEGGVTAYTYDANDNVTTVTDPEGYVTSYAYDKNNRVVSITDNNGNETRYGYDLNGNLTDIHNPDGGHEVYTYDLNDRQTSFTDGEGYTTLYVYDENGNTVEVQDPRGNSFHTEYDALDRPVKTINEEGGEVLLVYDAMGRIIQATNEDGAVTKYTYDAKGRVVAIEDAYGNFKRFEYDPRDNVTAETDENGITRTYTYDARGNVIMWTDGRGNSEKYRYDANDNMIKKIDRNGGEYLYTYDLLNRVTSETNPLGDTKTFTYNKNSQIVAVTDENGNNTYKAYPNGEYANAAYDAADQPIALEEYRLNGNKYFITTYDWDPAGNMLEEMQFNHGQSAFVDPSVTGEAPEVIEPDDMGDNHRGEFVPPPMTEEDGVVTNPGGNGNGNNGNNGNGNGNNGNGNGNNGNGNNGNGNGEAPQAQMGEHVYVYDVLNRLVQSTVLKEVTDFEYDSLGNLTYESTKSHAIDYRYNIMNQLVQKQTNNDTTSYTYDLRGNRVGETTKNKTRSYVFDATNHMVAGTNTSGDTSYYTYNGLDVRINNTQVTHSGNVYARDYVIDYNSYENNDILVFAEGEYVQQHVYRQSTDGHSERLMQLTDTAPGQNGGGGFERALYVHEDVQGNTRYYSKETGQTFAELQYDAYGAPLSPNKLLNNDHGNFVAANYTGHSYDTIIDFYFAEARFYDAANRTWTSRDPAKDGLNWYKYCADNPIKYHDPTGEFFWIAIGAAIGAVVGAAVSVVSDLAAGEPVDLGKAVAAAGAGAVAGALISTGVGAVVAAGTTALGAAAGTASVGAVVTAGMSSLGAVGTMAAAATTVVGTNILYRDVTTASDSTTTAQDVINESLNPAYIARDAGIGAFAGAGMFIATFGFSEFTASIVTSARETYGTIKNFFHEVKCWLTGNNSTTTAQTTQTVSNNVLQHVSKHIPSQFANQVPYLSDVQLANKLANTTFFNPNWGVDRVNQAIQTGYNTLSSAGATGRHVIEVFGEQIGFYIKPDGTLDSAWGLVKLTAEFFGR